MVQIRRQTNTHTQTTTARLQHTQGGWKTKRGRERKGQYNSTSIGGCLLRHTRTHTKQNAHSRRKTPPRGHTTHPAQGTQATGAAQAVHVCDDAQATKLQTACETHTSAGWWKKNSTWIQGRIPSRVHSHAAGAGQRTWEKGGKRGEINSGTGRATPSRTTCGTEARASART